MFHQDTFCVSVFSLYILKRVGILHKVSHHLETETIRVSLFHFSFDLLLNSTEYKTFFSNDV